MKPLYVKQLSLGPKQNFVYLVGAEGTPEVAVIDPAWDVNAIESAAAADGKQITAGFTTHCHDDHINGVPELLRRRDIPIYAQRVELEFSPELQKLGTAVRPLDPGQEVRVGPVTFKALHTPGHTPGSQCVHVEDALFSGDTLFVNRCGRCDFRGGDPAVMFRTLTEVLRPLPDSTRLLPGHDYGDIPISTLGREKAQNPYLQFEDVEKFIEFRRQPMAPMKK